MSTVVVEESESTELASFRERVRSWLEANASSRQSRPEDEDELSSYDTAGLPRAKQFQSALYDAGLAGLTWPREHGGQGLSREYQLAFNQEASEYELPIQPFSIGLGMCGPTILTHGAEEQKQRYIRPLLRADEVWCQLFSEPGAGSDVASLQSRAVRDGEEWVLNGQKVWTSGAQHSDFGIVIARTDPDQPKHRGISMFILDMHSPGVSVKPLRQMTGGANFNEVFFDDVRIPADNLLGGPGEGWRGAITMLMNERVAIGTGGGRRGGGSEMLIKAARKAGLEGDPVIRQRLMDVWIRQHVLGYLGQRIQDVVRSGRPPGPEGSVAKLAGAQLARISSELAVAIAGAEGMAWAADDPRGDRWAMMVCSFPGGAIAGGTNEVQRNIIGERVLGLPKEPQVDRDIPFRELKVGTQRPA